MSNNSITRFNRPLFTHVMPEGLAFLKLNELDISKTYTVRMLYINKAGYYGDSAIAVIDSCQVNLPAHLTDTVKEIMLDHKAVNEINQGKVAFKIVPYQNIHGRQFTVQWVEQSLSNGLNIPD